MNIQKLKGFLIEAKIHTYASNGEGGEDIFPDGSKNLKFEKGDFQYSDKYFGSESFGGEEIVSYKNKPIWKMAYQGGIIEKIYLKKEIYDFLQDALKKIPENKPFRGPSNLKKGNFEYFNQNSGNIQGFVGREHILYKNKKVYKLEYHGGTINHPLL